jgi:hypothetical protein
MRATPASGAKRTAPYEILPAVKTPPADERISAGCTVRREPFLVYDPALPWWSEVPASGMPRSALLVRDDLDRDKWREVRP